MNCPDKVIELTNIYIRKLITLNILYSRIIYYKNIICESL